MTSDYDGNESINVQDGDAFMDAYDSGACIGTCDIDGDGEVGLSDLVLSFPQFLLTLRRGLRRPSLPARHLLPTKWSCILSKGKAWGSTNLN